MLECKHQCPDKLDIVAGVQVDSVLAEIYHYLQFAYYKGEFIEGVLGLVNCETKR